MAWRCVYGDTKGTLRERYVSPQGTWYMERESTGYHTHVAMDLWTWYCNWLVGEF